MKNQMYVKEFSACYSNGTTGFFVAISKTSDESLVQKCINNFIKFDCWKMDFFKEEGVFIVTKEVFDTMFKDLFEEVKVMNKKSIQMTQREINNRILNIIYNSKWALTDDDCFQWVKQSTLKYNFNLFYCVQIMELPTKNPDLVGRDTDFCMVIKKIDLSDYINNGTDMLQTTVDILTSYGYGIDKMVNDYDTDEDYYNAVLNNFKNGLGSAWKQVLAEMIFETTCLYSADTILPFSTKEKAKGAILDYIEKHLD